MSLPGPSAPYFWPILGLGVGLAMALPRRHWPWLIGLLILIDLPFLDRSAYTLKSIPGFIIEYGSYFAVVLGGCWILRKLHPEGLDLTRLNPDLRNFLIAALLIATATGSIEPLFKRVAGAADITWVDWYHWFAIDLMSILVVAPFIAAWRIPSRDSRSLTERVSLLELGALAVVGFLVFYLELYGPPGEGRTNFDFIWVLVLWTVFRFDLRILTSVVLFSAAFVSARTSLTDDGLEYLADFWQDQSLIVTVYICVSVSVALILNSLVVSIRRQQSEINQARDYLDTIEEATGVPLYAVSLGASREKILYLNEIF